MNGNGKERVVPTELSILTDLYEDEADKDAIRKAYYQSATGDPGTHPVQFAVLLTANAQLLKTYPGRMKKVFETEAKKLADELMAQQNLVKQSTSAIAQTAATLIRESQQARTEAEKALKEIRLEWGSDVTEIKRAAKEASAKADFLKMLSITLVCWSIGIAFVMDSS